MAYPYQPYPQPYQPSRTFYPQPYQQPVMQQPQQQGGYSSASMPVSSKEEAMAVPADFSGLPMVFTDFANGKVYVKQWNNQRGAADFVTFVPEQPKPEPAKAEPLKAEDFVGKQEFERALENLQKQITELREGNNERQ